MNRQIFSFFGSRALVSFPPHFPLPVLPTLFPFFLLSSPRVLAHVSWAMTPTVRFDWKVTHDRFVSFSVSDIIPFVRRAPPPAIYLLSIAAARIA